jgi:hypothetical protein
MIEINKNTTDNSIDQRNRDLANIRGLHITFELLNETAAPLYFNWALVHPKAADLLVTSDGFFRGEGNNRGLDFSTSLSAMDFHLRAINSDKYVVLKHKRMMLNFSGSVGVNYQSGVGKNWAKFQSFTKINRQVRFDGETPLPINGQVFLVYWADQFMNVETSAALANAFRISRCITCFFRETRE